MTNIKLNSIAWACVTASIFAAAMASPSAANGQQTSLWHRRDPALTNQFADFKARRPGDLLVVLINQSSNVQNRDQRLLQKQNSSASGASASFGASGDIGAGAGGLNFDQDSCEL